MARVDPVRAAAVRRALRDWFRRHGRALPWRATRDPYRVLVSETMLQQTQVARVLEYYARFLQRFPTMERLAAASPRAVRESWDGLGYYARASNLHATARIAARTGGLPSDPQALRALPGIGRYTAGAVASFAFERRAALVDTNVARVLRRLFAPRADVRTARGQQRLWAIAQTLLPATGRAAWTHNQSLMELGALICVARAPRCDRCPVRAHCYTGKREMRNGKRDTEKAGRETGNRKRR